MTDLEQLYAQWCNVRNQVWHLTRRPAPQEQLAAEDADTWSTQGHREQLQSLMKELASVASVFEAALDPRLQIVSEQLQMLAREGGWADDPIYEMMGWVMSPSSKYAGRLHALEQQRAWLLKRRSEVSHPLIWPGPISPQGIPETNADTVEYDGDDDDESDYEEEEIDEGDEDVAEIEDDANIAEKYGTMPDPDPDVGGDIDDYEYRQGGY